jgi:ribonuclease P protein subunit RPR2
VKDFKDPLGSAPIIFTVVCSLSCTSKFQLSLSSKMGKKQKEDVPNINSIANRDIIQRLNFMYQASVYLQSLSTFASTSSTSSADSMDQSGVSPCEASGSVTEPSSPPKAAKGKRKRVIGRKKTVNDLARSYVHALKVVGQKTTVKM